MFSVTSARATSVVTYIETPVLEQITHYSILPTYLADSIKVGLGELNGLAYPCKFALQPGFASGPGAFLRGREGFQRFTYFVVSHHTSGTLFQAGGRQGLVRLARILASLEKLVRLISDFRVTPLSGGRKTEIKKDKSGYHSIDYRNFCTCKINGLLSIHVHREGQSLRRGRELFCG